MNIDVLNTPFNKYEQQIFDALVEKCPDVPWKLYSKIDSSSEYNHTTTFKFMINLPIAHKHKFCDVEIIPEVSSKIRIGLILYFFNLDLINLLDPHIDLNNYIVFGL